MLAGLYSLKEDKLYEAEPLRFTCDKSGGALQAVYDYETLRKTCDSNESFNCGVDEGLSSYFDLLPFEHVESLPEIPVGDTPIVNLPSFDSGDQKNPLFMLESYNPGGSVYDRGFTTACALAVENNFKTVAAVVFEEEELNSFIFSGLGCGLKTVLYCPVELAEKRTSLNSINSLDIIGVKAETEGELFDRAEKIISTENYYNCTLNYNPYSRDGLKTVAFEIFSRCKQIPDYIFLPAYRGALTSAVYRGFEELKVLGWIDTIPVIISGEMASEAFMTAIMQRGDEKQASKKLNIFDSVFAPRALRESKGKALALSEQLIKKAREQLIEDSGIKFTKRGSLGASVYINFKDNISPEDEVLVLLGGRENF